MTRLIISTNHREVLHSDVSGWLYVVDLDTYKILQKTSGIEPPYRIRDTNPRGGMRGMRGISIRNNELATANYSSIFFFDRQWNLLRTFTHPSVSAIHEILYTEDGVWVTSTANDLLAKFDRRGLLSEHHLVRIQRELLTKLSGTAKQILNSREVTLGRIDFRRRPYFNSDVYDRTHLNSITITREGKLLLSLGLIIGDKFSFLMTIKTLMLKIKVWNLFLISNRILRRVFRIRKQLHSELIFQPAKGSSAIVQFNSRMPWSTVLHFPTAHNPSHSVYILGDDTGVYLDTSNGEILHFDQAGNILSKTKISDKFLRGILELPAKRLAIGAGNTLLIYDLAEQKIIEEVTLSVEPLNTVFDIQILPSDFELPPDSLEAKVGRMIGFENQKVIWEKGFIKTIKME